MKKIILFLFLAGIFASCDKNNGQQQNTSGLKLKNNSGMAQEAYLDMAPYDTNTHDLEGSEFELYTTLTDSMLAANASWEYYDSMYSSSLHPGIQEYIGYLVLSKADLIGLAHNDLTNTTYQTALKKYINILVDKKYMGYCVLYFALTQVNDPVYKKTKAKEIVAYAQNDSSLDGADEIEEDLPVAVQKLQVNYSYIENLETMANQ